MEQKKTRVEIYKNENAHEALIQVMRHYGDDVPESTSKNVRCPFHNDRHPSFNIKDGQFKCFSKCGAKGDAFDYIQLKEGVGFQEALEIARKIFNIDEVKGKGKSKTELLDDFIKNNIKEFSGNPEYKYEEHYIYKDENNKAVLLKIKFRHPETKDKTFIMSNLIDEGTHYRMSKEKDENKVNLFYNAHLIRDAVRDNKKIYITEGEKDSNTLTKLGFTAISCRNTKSLTQEMINMLSWAHIVVVPDMDAAGKEHEKVLTDSLSANAQSFRVLKLYELTKHNKKDITEYVEILTNRGYSTQQIKNRIEELTQASLNLKDRYTLQQDRNGIKKFKPEEDKETGNITYTPIYITNFRITEAKICINDDKDKEYIEITTERYKYLTSEKPMVKVIRGEVKDILTDVKSFVEQLGLSLSFYGTGKDLVMLKEWIDRYFLVDEKHEYLRVGIRDDIMIDGKVQKCLMTQSGALMQDGTLNTEVKAVSNFAIIDLEGRKMLTKDDANELLKHMFKYTTPRNALNTWGSLVAGMLNPYYKDSSQNPHILHIWGASGKGKSFVLEEIIIPVLNTDAALSFETTTPHGLKLAFDETNVITLMDEVKPSKAKGSRLDTLSGAIRELTGSTKGLKGRKDQGANQTSYNSTLIMVGEEEITETAIRNRSNQVVYTDDTTTAEHIKHGEKIKTKKYRNMLKDLGFTLYLEILNNWSSERIDEVKEYILDRYPLKNEISIRERGTYVNTIMGLMILEDVLRRVTENNKLNIVEEAVKHVEENIFENILENGESSKQNYELWLEMFEDMVSTSDYRYLLEVGIHFRKIMCGKDECLAISFTDAYNKTYERASSLGEKLENTRTIKKLLSKSKYAYKESSKKVRFKTGAFGGSTTKDALILQMSELEKLGMCNTLEIARDDFKKQ